MKYYPTVIAEILLLTVQKEDAKKRASPSQRVPLHTITVINQTQPEKGFMWEVRTASGLRTQHVSSTPGAGYLSRPNL
jgi:hypothetical protein